MVELTQDAITWLGSKYTDLTKLEIHKIKEAALIHRYCNELDEKLDKFHENLNAAYGQSQDKDPDLKKSSFNTGSTRKNSIDLVNSRPSTVRSPKCTNASTAQINITNHGRFSGLDKFTAKVPDENDPERTGFVIPDHFSNNIELLIGSIRYQREECKKHMKNLHDAYFNLKFSYLEKVKEETLNLVNEAMQGFQYHQMFLKLKTQVSNCQDETRKELIAQRDQATQDSKESIEELKKLVTKFFKKIKIQEMTDDDRQHQKFGITQNISESTLVKEYMVTSMKELTCILKINKNITQKLREYYKASTGKVTEVTTTGKGILDKSLTGSETRLELNQQSEAAKKSEKARRDREFISIWNIFNQGF